MGGKFGNREAPIRLEAAEVELVQKYRPPMIEGAVDINDVYLCTLILGNDSRVEPLRQWMCTSERTEWLRSDVRIRRTGPHFPYGPKVSRTVQSLAGLGVDDRKAALWLNAGHYILTSGSFSEDEQMAYLRAEADRYSDPDGWLKLDGMKLTAIPEAVLKLGRLSRLSLERNPIVKIDPRLFSLQGLCELRLANTRIRQVPVDVRQASTLKLLDLENTKVKDLPDELFHLKELERLNAWGTPLAKDPERLEEIAHQLPEHCAFIAPKWNRLTPRRR